LPLSFQRLQTQVLRPRAPRSPGQTLHWPSRPAQFWSSPPGPGACPPAQNDSPLFLAQVRRRDLCIGLPVCVSRIPTVSDQFFKEESFRFLPCQVNQSIFNNSHMSSHWSGGSEGDPSPRSTTVNTSLGAGVCKTLVQCLGEGSLSASSMGLCSLKPVWCRGGLYQSPSSSAGQSGPFLRDCHLLASDPQPGYKVKPREAVSLVLSEPSGLSCRTPGQCFCVSWGRKQHPELPATRQLEGIV